MPDNTRTYKDYIEHRWTPEYRRHDRAASRYTGLHTGTTGLALAAALSALVAGTTSAAWQLSLFGVALVTMSLNLLYDFRDRARQHQRIAEALRREKEMYNAGAGSYAGRGKVAGSFVRRCEAILASAGHTLAPLVVEEQPAATPEDDDDDTLVLRPSVLSGSSPFRSTRSLPRRPEPAPEKDDEADNKDADDTPRSPFGSRSSSTSPFGSRSSNSPFGRTDDDDRERSSSPFSRRSPFSNRSSSSSRFSGGRPFGSSGGLRRRGDDDPALAGIENGNGRTGVRFAAYYPKELAPDVWRPVKAYAMLGYALDAVAADAEGGDRAKLPDILYDRNRNPRYRIPEGASVTVIPQMPGFQFNPATVTIGFYRTWHRFDFEMRATDARMDEATNGFLTFLVDGLIVADVPLSVYVGQGVSKKRDAVLRRVFRRPYREVYVSFGDGDRQFAERFRRVFDALGMYNQRDIMEMRSAEDWNPDLLSLVDEAEVFQLLWSYAAAESSTVQQELERAIERARSVDNFIRPVVWEQPAPALPDTLHHLKPAYMPDLVE